MARKSAEGVAAGALAVGAALMLASCSFTFQTSNGPTSTPTISPSPPIPPSDFTTYSNADPAFTIAHPSDWREELFASEGGVSGDIVAFISKPDSRSDDFTENVIVGRDTVPDGMTLEEYTAFSLANADKTVTNFQLMMKRPTTLSGLPAEAVEYTGTASGRWSVHWLGVWAVRRTSAYVITYVAEPDSYTRYLKDAEATIESFHLT